MNFLVNHAKMDLNVNKIAEKSCDDETATRRGIIKNNTTDDENRPVVKKFIRQLKKVDINELKNKGTLGNILKNQQQSSKLVAQEGTVAMESSSGGDGSRSSDAYPSVAAPTGIGETTDVLIQSNNDLDDDVRTIQTLTTTASPSLNALPRNAAGILPETMASTPSSIASYDNEHVAAPMMISSSPSDEEEKAEKDTGVKISEKIEESAYLPMQMPPMQYRTKSPLDILVEATHTVENGSNLFMDDVPPEDREPSPMDLLLEATEAVMAQHRISEIPEEFSMEPSLAINESAQQYSYVVQKPVAVRASIPMELSVERNQSETQSNLEKSSTESANQINPTATQGTAKSTVAQETNEIWLSAIRAYRNNKTETTGIPKASLSRDKEISPEGERLLNIIKIKNFSAPSKSDSSETDKITDITGIFIKSNEVNLDSKINDVDGQTKNNSAKTNTAQMRIIENRILGQHEKIDLSNLKLNVNPSPAPRQISTPPASSAKTNVYKTRMIRLPNNHYHKITIDGPNALPSTSTAAAAAATASSNVVSPETATGSNSGVMKIIHKPDKLTTLPMMRMNSLAKRIITSNSPTRATATVTTSGETVLTLPQSANDLIMQARAPIVAVPQPSKSQAAKPDHGTLKINTISMDGNKEPIIIKTVTRHGLTQLAKPLNLEFISPAANIDIGNIITLPSLDDVAPQATACGVGELQNDCAEIPEDYGIPGMEKAFDAVNRQNESGNISMGSTHDNTSFRNVQPSAESRRTRDLSLPRDYELQVFVGDMPDLELNAFDEKMRNPETADDGMNTIYRSAEDVRAVEELSKATEKAKDTASGGKQLKQLEITKYLVPLKTIKINQHSVKLPLQNLVTTTATVHREPRYDRYADLNAEQMRNAPTNPRRNSVQRTDTNSIEELPCVEETKQARTWKPIRNRLNTVSIDDFAGFTELPEMRAKAKESLDLLRETCEGLRRKYNYMTSYGQSFSDGNESDPLTFTATRSDYYRNMPPKKRWESRSEGHCDYSTDVTSSDGYSADYSDDEFAPSTSAGASAFSKRRAWEMRSSSSEPQEQPAKKLKTLADKVEMSESTGAKPKVRKPYLTSDENDGPSCSFAISEDSKSPVVKSLATSTQYGYIFKSVDNTQGDYKPRTLNYDAKEQQSTGARFWEDGAAATDNPPTPPPDNRKRRMTHMEYGEPGKHSDDAENYPKAPKNSVELHNAKCDVVSSTEAFAAVDEVSSTSGRRAINAVAKQAENVDDTGIVELKVSVAPSTQTLDEVDEADEAPSTSGRQLNNKENVHNVECDKSVVPSVTTEALTAIDVAPSTTGRRSAKKQGKRMPAAVADLLDDDQFNPRLLLITKRAQLETDEPLTCTAATAGMGPIQCGLCLARTSNAKWKAHLTEHYGVGWIVGQEKINLSERNKVLNCMVKYFKSGKAVVMKCRLCQKPLRSAVGLLCHLESCGEPQVRMACEFCHKEYTKSSLKLHIRSCPGLTNVSKPILPVFNKDIIVEHPEAVYSNAGRLKRASLIKAEDKLKEVSKMLNDEATPKRLDYKKCIKYQPAFKIGESLRNGWATSLSTSKTIDCPHSKCSIKVETIEAMEKHLNNCSHAPKAGYYCTYCTGSTAVIFSNEENALRHAKAKHSNNGFRADDDSDCTLDTSDTSETESSVDDTDSVISNNVPSSSPRTPQRRIKRNKHGTPLREYLRVYPDRTEDIRKLARTKWMQFMENNYAKTMLYDDMKSKISAVHIDGIETKMLGTQMKSMKYAKLKDRKRGDTPANGGDNIEWSDLKRLECKELAKNNEFLLFLGGACKSATWIPLPSDVQEQYLIINFRRNNDKYTRTLNPKTKGALLLMYRLSPMNGAFDRPQLVYGLVVPDGAVHCVELLPSGGYDVAANRLALAAIGTSASGIKIYALPIVATDVKEQRLTDTLNAPIIELKPAFILAVELVPSPELSESHCLHICWSQFRTHQYIFAAFSNSVVGIWDLDAPEYKFENMNFLMIEDVTFYVPLLSFCAGQNIVKTLNVHYDEFGPRWLLLTFDTRKMQLYGLTNVAAPELTRNYLTKNLVRCIDWPLIWEPMLVGYCDLVINGARRIEIKHPLKAPFDYNPVDKMTSSISTIHYSPWHAMCAASCDCGDMNFYSTRELNLNDPITEKYTAEYELKMLDGGRLITQKDIVTGACTDWRMYEDDYKEKYGIVFHSLREEEVDTSSTAPDPPMMFKRYMRTTCLRWNLNTGGQKLLAYGYENGFVRILCFDDDDFKK